MLYWQKQCLKVLSDVKCEPDLALSWSLAAKNSLLNNNGFSPNQLVFGESCRFPSVVTDNLPTYDVATTEVMKKKLQVMQSAKENFVKAESSDRVKRALRHKTRTFSDANYTSGEQVYYKNPAKGKGWLGPATVMGQNASLVLVQDGVFFLSCSSMPPA